MRAAQVFWSDQRAATWAAAVLVTFVLQGCGRYGPLEPPSTAVTSAKSEDRHDFNVRRANQAIAPPKKDFVLDPLLQ